MYWCTMIKPYKCPVCDGKVEIMFILIAGGDWEDPCKSCEGKGLVWKDRYRS